MFWQNLVDSAKPLLRKAIQISQQTPYWHCRLLFQLAVCNPVILSILTCITDDCHIELKCTGKCLNIFPPCCTLSRRFPPGGVCFVCNDTSASICCSNFTHWRRTWCRRATCSALAPSTPEWLGQNTHGKYRPDLFLTACEEPVSLLRQQSFACPACTYSQCVFVPVWCEVGTCNASRK